MGQTLYGCHDSFLIWSSPFLRMWRIASLRAMPVVRMVVTMSAAISSVARTWCHGLSRCLRVFVCGVFRFPISLLALRWLNGCFF